MKLKKTNIIFLVSEDSFFIYDFIKKIYENKIVNIKLIVIQDYKENFKRKLLLAFLIGINNCLKLFYELNFKRGSLSIQNFCESKKINFIITKDINKSHIIKKIKSFESDLIINLNVMKLFKKKFINKFSSKLINLHPGILPKYRGLYSTFYKILNNEKFYGITSHFMTDKVDHGKIIAIVKKKLSKKNLFLCYNVIYKELIFKLFYLTIKSYKKKILLKKRTKIYRYPNILQILKYKLLNFYI